MLDFLLKLRYKNKESLKFISNIVNKVELGIDNVAKVCEEHG